MKKELENVVILDGVPEGFKAAILEKAPGAKISRTSDALPADERVAQAKKLVEGEIALGMLGAYAVVTRDPKTFSAHFTSNNVLDAKAGAEKTALDVAWVFSNFGRDRAGDPFVIADSHFFHRNIIKYCRRPWFSRTAPDGSPDPTDEDVARMNEDMISRWNSVVGKDDVVYSLGDFCFGNRDKVQSVFDRLNGRKRIVLGNHDRLKFNMYYDIGFERVYDKPVIIQKFVVLSHAPLEWVQDGGVMANVYGHVHNQSHYRDFTSNTFCASAERIGYTPIRLSEVFRHCASFREDIA